MEFVLFMTGLALVAAEIFIIPGFGIAGITGALMMIWVVGKGFLDFEILMGGRSISVMFAKEWSLWL